MPNPIASPPADLVIPDLRLVEPSPTRTPPPLPYPGPESAETYRPTTRLAVTISLGADGSMPPENAWLSDWLYRSAQCRDRADRDPGYKAYVTSRAH